MDPAAASRPTVTSSTTDDSHGGHARFVGTVVSRARPGHHGGDRAFAGHRLAGPFARSELHGTGCEAPIPKAEASGSLTAPDVDAEELLPRPSDDRVSLAGETVFPAG